jgi:hypothetical protein
MYRTEMSAGLRRNVETLRTTDPPTPGYGVTGYANAAESETIEQKVNSESPPVGRTRPVASFRDR